MEFKNICFIFLVWINFLHAQEKLNLKKYIGQYQYCEKVQQVHKLNKPCINKVDFPNGFIHFHIPMSESEKFFYLFRGNVSDLIVEEFRDYGPMASQRIKFSKYSQRKIVPIKKDSIFELNNNELNQYIKHCLEFKPPQYLYQAKTFEENKKCLYVIKFPRFGKVTRLISSQFNTKSRPNKKVLLVNWNKTAFKFQLDKFEQITQNDLKWLKSNSFIID
jgi:hypothetical protein